MRRPRRVRHIVHVGAVDADERHLYLYQKATGVRSEERAGAEVVGTAPALRSAGANEHRPTAEIEPAEHAVVDGAFAEDLHHDTLQVGQLLQHVTAAGNQAAWRRKTEARKQARPIPVPIAGTWNQKRTERTRYAAATTKAVTCIDGLCAKTGK